jgi:folylpolyglutamate synthase/dihydropteroate synthase
VLGDTLTQIAFEKGGIFKVRTGFSQLPFRIVANLMAGCSLFTGGSACLHSPARRRSHGEPARTRQSQTRTHTHTHVPHHARAIASLNTPWL